MDDVWRAVPPIKNAYVLDTAALKRSPREAVCDHMQARMTGWILRYMWEALDFLTMGSVGPLAPPAPEMNQSPEPEAEPDQE